VATDADLFGGAVLPPIVVNRRHAAAATTTTATKLAKKKTNIISSFVNNDSEDDDDDDDNDDDELAHEETSSSQDISTAAITTTTVEKTKQEIHEETQNKLRRTIFVGNLPPDITRKALASLFASTLDCGKVESARLRSIPVTGIKLPPQYAGDQRLMRKVCINTGRVGYNSVIATDAPSIGGGGGIVIAKTCAQGYVVFEKLESVQLALNKNNTMYENRTMRVDRVVVVPDYHANNSTITSVDGGSSTTTTTTTIKHDIAKNSVFVGNLPYGADEETLRRHFMSVLLGDGSDDIGGGGSNEEEDGSSSTSIIITGVRIIRDSETRQCKGFGYIALRDGTYIADALRAHGTVYMKRELRVMICGRGGRGMKMSGSGAKSLAGRGGGLRPRTFEGHRTTTRNHSSTSTSNNNNNNNNKRKLDNGGGVGGSVTKKRRARSEKKTSDGGGKASSSKGERLSKRAATEARVKKRVKKLQQRVVKGMGKKKK
jgi:nucleolar protein 12